ncbi:MAG: hypothetical protein ACJAQ6_001969 [Arenicella sp.]|jgi:hypothetical protein
MSKDSLQIKEITGKVVGFTEFWQTISSELGNSRFKINTKAESIKYFLAAESDHKDFFRVLIRQTYKRCHCYHLNARFDVNVALDVLGETSYTLQGTKEDDLMDIELLEEIAWLINQHYGYAIKMPKSMLADHPNSASDNSTSNSNNVNRGKTGPVFSMSKLKIRRANQKL